MVPPITTFRWGARDYIDDLLRYQDPESTRYILVPFVNNNFDETIDSISVYADSMWSPWMFYDSNNDTTRSAVSPTLEIGGNYVFAVQAKDEAGAITPIFDEQHNVRRLLASKRTTGPALTVNNKFIGNVAGASISTPIVIFDMPEGIPLIFTWTATAAHYGGLVSGYRYGWDIVNLNEDDEWEVDFTPFIGSGAASPERTFYFGTHTLYVEVVDNSGFKSRVGIRINVIPFTMERDLLMVDDFPDGAGIHATKGALPSDAEHDLFWLNQLAAVAKFDPTTDFLNVDRGSQIPIITMAKYKSIIWDVYGWHSFSAVNTPTLLYQLISFRRPDSGGGGGGGKVIPNLLALYLEAGGHLLLCGFQPMSMSVNRAYFSGGIQWPFITLYEAGGTQTGNYNRDGEIGRVSFAYRDYCVDAIDIAATSSIRTEFCVVTRRSEYGDGLRSIIPVDTLDLPEAALNSTVTLGGYFFETRGMNSEIYNPDYPSMAGCRAITYINEPRECIEFMFKQKTGNPLSVVNEAPVGIWTKTFARVMPPVGMPARSVLWGFEPYFLEEIPINEALQLILFEEWKLQKN
jgi:hypothetical protein